MKKFKVCKADLWHDNEFYPEGTVEEFDEKNKSIKKLIDNQILVPVKAEVKSPGNQGVDVLQQEQDVILNDQKKINK